MTTLIMVITTRKAILILGYTKWNKYSANALLGAIEKEGLDERVRITTSDLRELPNLIVSDLRAKYELIIVAISLMSTQLPQSLNLIKEIVGRVRRVGALVLVGGPHATGDPYGSLLSLGFDIAFLGESEKTFTSFLRALVEGEDPLQVQGIAFWDGEKVILKNRPRPIDLSEYPPFSIKYGLLGPIEISRGCPFACKYCQVSYMFGARFRHREVNSVIRYALALIKRGLRDIRFISPNSFGYGSDGKSINVEAMSQLVSELQKVRELGGRIYLGTFPSEVRPDFVNEESVKLIKGRVDNKRITIGAQSGSDRVLKFIGRSHTVEDVLNAVRILRQYGFGVDVDYIFGLPGESEEDTKETIAHMVKVASMGARVHAHVFLPLPGTPFAFEAPGRITPNLRRELFKLLGRGLVYGQWAKQELLASEIDRLRRDYVIIVTPRRAEEALAKLSKSGCKARPISEVLSKVMRIKT